MSHKLTLDEFIKRSKGVHGNKYDYSEVNYVNTKTKVVIICPKHGAFNQKPEKHMAGQGCPLCSNDKLEETNLKRYGVRRPIQSKTIHKRLEQTNLERYGATNCLSNPEIREKAKKSCRDKYGVDYTMQSDEFQKRKIETCRKKYGGDSPFSSDDIRNKAKVTVQKRYGISNVMKDVAIKVKVTDAKRKNNTFAVSKPENTLYQALCEYFGKQDVCRQYFSND